MKLPLALALGLLVPAPPALTAQAPATGPVVYDPTVPRPHTVDRQGLPAGLATAVDGYVAGEMDEQQMVGLSLALARGDEVTDLRSYGWEDFGRRWPATAATRYRWASISKPLTAVLALRLAARGDLDLDADVRGLVPEFPEKEHTVTARLILCHQSGIPHYRGARRTPREYDVEHPFADRILALDMFKDSPLVAPPGTRYHYSTHAYVLLGAVVQRAAGTPFDELVAKHVSEPLELTTLRPDYEWQEIPHRAQGYHRAGEDRVIQSDTESVAWKVPGGGLISTVGDLARFGAALGHGTLLDEASRTAMNTPQKTADGETTPMGLGIRIGERDGHRLLSHSGSQNKTATMLLLDPGRRMVVAVMSNSYRSNVRRIARRIHTIVTGPAERR